MAAERAENIKDAADARAENDGRKNERSSIEFPYGDLDSAVKVAKAIHDNAGQSCSPENLAAYLGMVGNTGGFRARIAPARVFGLIDVERGRIGLTSLGRQIVDPSQERTARVDAFLTVPLYSAIFERYKAHLLPPEAALEKEMAQLGVSSKQTDKARQAFERSAQQAGFFAHGKERLVKPELSRAPETKPVAEQNDQRRSGGGGGEPPSELHEAIRGLLRKLPPHDSDFPIADRVKWLRAFSAVLGVLYPTDGDVSIEARAEA